MASYPSGVTIVITTDHENDWWGFTATSFCSLSADPRLVLVCVARAAECFNTFMGVNSWIHFVPPTHAELALRFATRGADKFSGGEFTENKGGLPVLTDASVFLECEAHSRYNGGDHVVLVGRLTDATIPGESPAVYFRRTFQCLDGHISGTAR